MKICDTTIGMVLLACAAACTSGPETAPEAPPEGATRTEVIAPAPVIAAPPPVVKVEPVSLVFAPVIEGNCPELGVSLVDDQTFVHANPGNFVGRLLPDGTLEDLSVASTIEGVNIQRLEAVEGAWPDELFLRYQQIDGRQWEGSRYLRRQAGAWLSMNPGESDDRRAEGAERIYRWSGGNWLGRMTCRDWKDSCKDVGLLLNVVRGPGKAPKFPELRSKEEGCLTTYSLAVLPGGEIVAVGRMCHIRSDAEEGGAYYAVRWSEQGGTQIDRLPVRQPEARGREPGPVIAVSPSQVYAAVLGDGYAEPATLFAFDGAKWTTLPKLAGAFGGMDVDRDGSLWVNAAGKLSRLRPGGAWEPQTFTTGPVKQIGGLRDPVGWVTQADGTLWLRPEGQEFARAELPPPAYSATASYKALAVVSAGRDVWITARYGEMGPGWKTREDRRALLHNGPPREPLRCAQQPDFNPTRGTVVWPAAARDDCATPFAILIRPSRSMPKDHKHPELGKLLKGQQAFAAVKFAEVEIGGQRLVGAAVPDVAVGRALVERIGKQVKRSRPELVCATPTQLRPLPFDLTTGKLAPEVKP